jgi:hypothetical protein
MNPKRTITFAAALAAGAACASPAHAQLLITEAPALYRGGAICATKFPGSFLDLGTAACWQCPATHPRRTIFPIAGTQACERPAYEAFKRASGPENPTGFLRTDCRSGWFLDIGKGKCYSCAGYNRTAYPIDHARACSKAIPAAWASAARRGVEGCPAGSFRNALTAYCYACPPDYSRNAVVADDLTKVNACSKIGDAVREATRAKFEAAKEASAASLAFLGRIANSVTTYDTKTAAFDLLGRELMKAAIDGDFMRGSGLNAFSLLANIGGSAVLGYTHGFGYVITKVNGINQCYKTWSNTFTAGGSVGAGVVLEAGLAEGVSLEPSESNGWQISASYPPISGGSGLFWDAKSDDLSLSLTFGPGFGVDANLSEYAHTWSETGKLVVCDRMTWGAGWGVL